METTHTPSSNNSNKNLNSFLNDDDSFDLDFQPITEGLGFQDQQKEKDELINLKKSSKAKRNTVDTLSFKQNLERGDLAPFYDPEMSKPFSMGEEVKEVSLEEEPKISSEEVFRPAGTAYRLFANIVDLIIISVITLATLYALAFIAGIDWNFLERASMQNEVILYIGLLFSIYYLFYFTFMELTENSSVGKSMMNISLIGKDGNKPKVFATFSRAMLNLISLTLIGLPSLLNLVDRLTATEVRENEL